MRARTLFHVMLRGRRTVAIRLVSFGALLQASMSAQGAFSTVHRGSVLVKFEILNRIPQCTPHQLCFLA